MSKTIRIPLTWPTTRKDGSALALADIASGELQISGDAGANFIKLADLTPGQASIDQSLDTDGTYLFRGVCFDKQTPALSSDLSNVVSYTLVTPPVVLAPPDALVLGTPIEV